MYRRRATRDHNPRKPAARRSQSQSKSKSANNLFDESDAWPGSCSSPASTDIESDVSSVLDSLRGAFWITGCGVGCGVACPSIPS